MELVAIALALPPNVLHNEANVDGYSGHEPGVGRFTGVRRGTLAGNTRDGLFMFSALTERTGKTTT